MDTQAWHAKLISALGRPCRIEDCETPAERLRYRVNPVWGLDTDGQTALTEGEFLAEVQTLIDQEADSVFTFDELQVLCLPHFTATLPKSASGIAQGPDELGDRGAGPSEQQRVQTKKFRTQVLELLGQQCSLCNRQLQVKSLEVRLRQDVTANFWAQNGLSSWADKYAYLADPEVDPAEIVEAVCRFCVDARVSGGRTVAKQNLRAKVIEGYGGKCGVCDVEVSARTVWVVRREGFAAMRHAGGVGRKLTSKQKYERLLAQGCPESHELRCPSHRDTDSLGTESQVVEN